MDQQLNYKTRFDWLAKANNHKVIAWLEPFREILEVVMVVWAAVIGLYLTWFIYAPSEVYPDSPGLYVNHIVRMPDKEETTEPLVTAPVKTIPGINQFKGNPSFEKNVSKFDKHLAKASDKYKIDCTLLKAQMMAESRGEPKAYSSVGAVGLMQLMPATARAMGYPSNLNDPLTSIMAGAKYFLHLERTACYEKPTNEVCDTAQDIKYQIAAYNGGSRCNKLAYVSTCPKKTMWECEWFDGYGETRNYVNKVKANYHYLKENGWGC